ncbi:hypothetical protein ABIB25_000923 [Nakamurella sp. UYEF19]|uniref:hypothetical protein n=1 Tax=Nakamurella sp. UYEF19 TaxID=1756392 RepID=UPI003398145B
MSRVDNKHVESLLHEVAVAGWESSSGRELLTVHAPMLVRNVAAAWSRTAGESLERDLVSRVWEVWRGLIMRDEIENAVQIARFAVKRSAPHTAAMAQSGIGSERTRGLVAAVRDKKVGRLSELPDTLVTSHGAASSESLPRWAVLLGVLLVKEGWSWPVPALGCIADVMSSVAETARRRRSPMAFHDTGVPAETWGALELLIFGGGPGGLRYRRPPSAAAVWGLHGDSGLRSDDQILRVVRAAVAGRPTRAGRPRLAVSA